MDGVKEDRAECMAELEQLHAKIEMANNLLDKIASYEKAKPWSKPRALLDF